MCLGAPLSRLEARSVFAVLARRLADPRPAGEVRRPPLLMNRGVSALPMTFARREA